MSMVPDPIGQAGLTYFGRITASVSHELKNALAIIRENAGLLNDYVLMSEKGQPPDGSRFKTVSLRIEDQVRRADKIIKNLNRFAHCADHPLASVDLSEMTALLLELSMREAAMRQVTLAQVPAEPPVIVRTAPFMLLTLLGRCLSFVLGAMASGQIVNLRAVRSENGARISLEHPFCESLAAEDFPRPLESALLSALDATISVDAANGRLTIMLSNR